LLQVLQPAFLPPAAHLFEGAERVGCHGLTLSGNADGRQHSAAGLPVNQNRARLTKAWRWLATWAAA
jgi:hypothetical protein